MEERREGGVKVEAVDLGSWGLRSFGTFWRWDFELEALGLKLGYRGLGI